MKKTSLLSGIQGNKAWDSGAVKFNYLRTVHYGSKKVGYENSLTDRGYILQLSLYSGEYVHTATTRKTYVITIDIVEEQYPQDKFHACVVVSTKDRKIKFVQRCSVAFVPVACVNALRSEGDLKQFIDRDNLINLPKHIVSCCLHQFEELWR